MLTEHWRLRASNTQNQAITVTVTAKYFRHGTDGQLVWSAEQTLISAVSVAATTGTTASSTVTNTTDKWTGMVITAFFTAAVTTNGSGAVSLTLETSTDAGTTWPTQDLGRFVGGYTVTAADTTNARRRSMLAR